MPTKKRRVGFIPRSEVLDMIKKLSFESNLSISKVINILVEEALYKRGMYKISYSKVLNSEEGLDLKNDNQIKKKNEDQNLFIEFNNVKNTENKHLKDSSDDFIDKEIYSKFLMFLQFQEKMKKRN